MKLIVAGLGRTGTQSLVAALKHLGLTTMSQENFLADMKLLQHLLGVVQDGEELDFTHFEGIDATIGWPLCWIVEQQLQLFPDAKVLLNVRDPDSWFDSITRSWTVMGALRKLPKLGKRIRTMNRMLQCLIDRMGCEPPERVVWTAGYNAHIALIRSLVPTDRLAVYEIGSGWEPICEFLNLPVPQVPFPRSNTGASGDLKRKITEFLK